jgi:hypothetical protein
VPHIYLTVDIRLDALLKLRTELNASLEARGVKLSVNDFMIKALAVALIGEPKCNVMYTPTELITFKRADISVAVSTPTGLITPIIADASAKSLSAISAEMKDLAARARDGKLQPHEYQGGTASLSNMGMYGIKHFEAVINPPQGMIMAIGAGEKAAARSRRQPADRDGDERDRQLRPPRDRWRGRGRADEAVQGAGGKPAGDDCLNRATLTLPSLWLGPLPLPCRERGNERSA